MAEAGRDQTEPQAPSVMEAWNRRRGRLRCLRPVDVGIAEDPAADRHPGIEPISQDRAPRRRGSRSARHASGASTQGMWPAPRTSRIGRRRCPRRSRGPGPAASSRRHRRRSPGPAAAAPAFDSRRSVPRHRRAAAAVAGERRTGQHVRQSAISSARSAWKRRVNHFCITCRRWPRCRRRDRLHPLAPARLGADLGGGVGEDGGADEVRPLGREALGHDAADREPDEDGAADAEGVHQPGGVGDEVAHE